MVMELSMGSQLTRMKSRGLIHLQRGTLMVMRCFYYCPCFQKWQHSRNIDVFVMDSFHLMVRITDLIHNLRRFNMGTILGHLLDHIWQITGRFRHNRSHMNQFTLWLMTLSIWWWHARDHVCWTAMHAGPTRKALQRPAICSSPWAFTIQYQPH